MLRLISATGLSAQSAVLRISAIRWLVRCQIAYGNIRWVGCDCEVRAYSVHIVGFLVVIGTEEVFALM
jgi:hypothetical protein